MMNFYYILKSLLLNIRFGYFRKRQIQLKRGGSLVIHSTGQLVLNNGFLFINRKHFKNSYRPNPGLVWVEENASFRLDADHFSLCEGARIHVRPNAQLHIEGKGFINTDTEIDCYSKIFIGRGTIISSNCYITDSDQHRLIVDEVNMENTKSIHIGRQVWIGRNLTILKGVTIGDNAVIASNSLVNRNVPSGQLWGGIPSKKIKENVNWEF